MLFDLSVPAVQYVLLGAMALGLIYHLLAVSILARERMRDRSHRIPLQNAPPISIFKPLKGLDDELEVNLRSFFQLNYPRYEILFGVSSPDDPAIDVVKRLLDRYPDVEARLIVNGHSSGLNPKVNNLINLKPWARFDHFVISDSNVRVNRDYLTNLMKNLNQPGTGLVTSTILGSGAHRWGGVLENLHLNTFVATSVFAVSRLFRRPVVIGKSMLLKREVLRNLGGFEHYRNYLLEDELIGLDVMRLGMAVRTTFDPVISVNHSMNLRQFWARQLRWATMRRHLNLGHYVSEFLGNPIVPALLFCLWQPGPTSFLLLAATCVTKITLDLTAGVLVGSPTPFIHYMLIPLKDIVLGMLWVIPFVNRHVVWRDRRFAVHSGTRLSVAASHQPHFANALQAGRQALGAIVTPGVSYSRTLFYRLSVYGKRRFATYRG